MEQTSSHFELVRIKSANETKNVGLFKMTAEDIRCALHRDPAARNWFEVLVNYSSLHAVWFYRISHWLWQRKFYFFARWLTGVEIHPGAVIGHLFFIDHGMGVVIGETSEIGDNVTFYHGVTLVVVKPVPPDSVVVGVPGQIVKRSGKHAREIPDLHHNRLPDTLGQALQQVMARLDNMEDKMHVHQNGHITTNEEGTWIGTDFSI